MTQEPSAPNGFPHELRPIFTRMTEGDLPAVLAIEKRSFPTAWSENVYRHEIRHRTASYWVVRPGVVQRPPNTPPILAYGGLWLLDDEAHVTTIASHPDWRQRRLGEWTLLNLLHVARNHGVFRVTLEARTTNKPAIALYHKLGFVSVGVRRGYYRDTGEDARLLTLYRLQDPDVWGTLNQRLEAIETESPQQDAGGE